MRFIQELRGWQANRVDEDAHRSNRFVFILAAPLATNEGPIAVVQLLGVVANAVKNVAPDEGRVAGVCDVKGVKERIQAYCVSDIGPFSLWGRGQRHNFVVQNSAGAK